MKFELRIHFRKLLSILYVFKNLKSSKYKNKIRLSIKENIVLYKIKFDALQFIYYNLVKESMRHLCLKDKNNKI